MNSRYFITRTACPGCTSERFRIIYSCGFTESPIREVLQNHYTRPGGIEFEYLQGAQYVVAECTECGLVFQRDIAGDFLMHKLYEEWIDPTKATDPEAQEENYRYARQYAQEIMMLIEFLSVSPQDLKFFDFGMGWGRWCLMARAFGCQVYGTELSPTRMDYARAQGIRVISGDEIPPHQFDVINTEQVFEHLPQPLETLRHLKKALKPGGLLKISVPDGSNIMKRLKKADWSAPKRSHHSLNPIHPLEHINCYSRPAIVHMAARVELRPVHFPLAVQYQALTGGRPGLDLVKNLVKPLYRALFPRSSYLFFQDARKT